MKQDTKEEKSVKSEDKEGEKKKESTWLKPKSIIKKYVSPHDFLQPEWI